jgi:hypothetical protein
MAKYTIVAGTQLPNKLRPGWYIKRTDPDDHWDIVGQQYPKKEDAQAEADRLNNLPSDV